MKYVEIGCIIRIYFFGGVKMEEIKNLCDEQNDTNDIFSSESTMSEKNNETNCVKSKKRKGIFLSITIMFLLLFSSFSAVCYYEAKNVTNAIESQNISIAAKKCKKINLATKFIFKNMILNSLEKSVKENPYTSYGNGDIIVYGDALSDYKKYNEIINELNISPNQNKTAKYIDKVLELSEYEKYNSICTCLYDTLEDISTAQNCIKKAATSYSSYSKSMNYAAALDSLTSARKCISNQEGYLVSDFLAAVNTMMQGLTASFANSANLSGNFGNKEDLTKGQNMLLNIVNELEGPSKERNEIIDEIKRLE